MSERTSDGEHSQYLTFEVTGEEYAIAILDAREIIPYAGCTRVPTAPEPVRGLINLRGRAVPILDLEIVFGRSETELSKRACVVIVNPSDDDDDDALMGILAGAVNAVISLPEEDLEAAPTFGTGVRAECLLGMAKIDERFIPVLDLAQVLSLDAVAGVSAVQDDGTAEPDDATEVSGPVQPAAPDDEGTAAEAQVPDSPEKRPTRSRAAKDRSS